MVKQRSELRQMIIAAVLIAVNVVVSRVFVIPVPMTNGYLNLSDGLIIVAALLMGTKWGAAVGGLSGFLLDLFAGYGQYMFFSLIIHGLEGLVAGSALHFENKYVRFLIVVASALLMVVGYWLVDTFLYSPAAGLAGIIPNLFQAGAGVLVALILLPIFRDRLAIK
ncbi:ECF transporter S component [Lentilactobacillus senioris]|uniref:Integral membrane protein n=1 Tax=Lentilactobacillus senioris DSM 24302 = JCM 17472 TaxID=1423802 RepID=A0A0R2CRA2_9LACO|nr:ECF transporter S component [Lentilactobacillus senioris]KRM94200.1 hypothetical protein FC56_GL001148 [Lentilactobacillus senioris DSM 24302 = JCM 17472]